MKVDKIVFMGTPDFAVPALAALVEDGYEVQAVVTQPDKPRGRGMVTAMSPVKEVGLRYGIKVYQPVRLEDEDFVAEIKLLAPDAIVVVAYGRILPGKILDIPSKGCINVHASLLPKYRGAAPINWAIINGEQETGVTIMLMDRGMDTGPILSTEKVLIGSDDTAGDLHDRLKHVGAGLLVRTLKLFAEGTVVPVPQDNSQATYAPMLKKEDGRIEWKKSAVDIRNLVRGLFPWPGAYTSYRGVTLKILNGDVLDTDKAERPGTIISAEGDSIDVATGEGIFGIKEIQPAGKKRMKVTEFLRGCEIVKGEILYG